MQINRLFEMVYLLLHRKQMTTKELAAHFEVSTRTILRDVETLSSAGIPIYTTRGRGGGVALMSHFVLNKAALTAEEQEQILLALESLSVTESTATAETLTKLRSFFARDIEPWIEVDFSQWGGGGMDGDTFQRLKQAVVNGLGISFRYYNSYGQASTREALPLKLIFRSKAWYLSAYCKEKQAIRLFKINRMRGLSLTGEEFERSDYPQLEAKQASSPPPECIQSIRMRFSETVAYRLYDEFDAETIEHGPEGLTVTMTAPMGGWVLGYILSFGDQVEVLGPECVVAMLQEQARRILAMYEK